MKGGYVSIPIDVGVCRASGVNSCSLMPIICTVRVKFNQISYHISECNVVIAVGVIMMSVLRHDNP